MLDNLDQDVFSSILMRMKLKSSAAGALDAGGRWAIQFPVYEDFKLQLVLKGEAWISVEGEPSNYHVKAGDCLLTTGGKPFVVARDLSIQKKIKVESLFRTAKNGVLTVNEGGDFLSVGTIFQFDGHLHKIIFAHLPSVIHIPGHLEQAAVLRWSIELFRAEYLERNVGRSLVMNHLTSIMLLQILRIYMTSAKAEKNWLGALRDPKLSKAIEVMHSEYQKSWSLDSLAKVTGLSRSGFALNFRKQIGISPMDYLTNWRIQIACGLLQTGEMSMFEVANAVGYESESAFSDAFKRILIVRPGFYQKNYGDLSQGQT
ncbi:MAG: AraC family transcriptional regulator [Candidatus Obscuribacterales bacterium]|nr:AraC family transcriptional regulator [Candidatus Obscuribacterales bacterium]